MTQVWGSSSLFMPKGCLNYVHKNMVCCEQLKICFEKGIEDGD
jgi:hypothetical protein